MFLISINGYFKFGIKLFTFSFTVPSLRFCGPAVLSYGPSLPGYDPTLTTPRESWAGMTPFNNHLLFLHVCLHFESADTDCILYHNHRKWYSAMNRESTMCQNVKSGPTLPSLPYTLPKIIFLYKKIFRETRKVS